MHSRSSGFNRVSSAIPRTILFILFTLYAAITVSTYRSRTCLQQQTTSPVVVVVVVVTVVIIYPQTSRNIERDLHSKSVFRFFFTLWTIAMYMSLDVIAATK